MKLFVFTTLSAFLVLSSCAKSGDGSVGATGGQRKINAQSAGLQGLWMQKDEAEELKKTGTIRSICEEIKKSPEVAIMNVRLIDQDGVIYIYKPQFGLIEQFRLGQIAENYEVILAPFFKKQIGDATTMKVALDDLTLKFIYDFSGQSAETAFSRSSPAEVDQYYAVQESCKK